MHIDSILSQLLTDRTQKQKHIIMYDTVLKLVKTTNNFRVLYVQDWVSIVIYTALMLSDYKSDIALEGIIYCIHILYIYI